MPLTIALLRYWREGVIALLLALCAILWLSEKAADRRAAKFQGQLAVANAMIERQNEAVRELEAEGKRLRANVERARQEGLAGIEAARKERLKLSALPKNGCPTPPEILEAYR